MSSAASFGEREYGSHGMKCVVFLVDDIEEGIAGSSWCVGLLRDDLNG